MKSIFILMLASTWAMAAQDEWGLIRKDSFRSIVNGKTIESRISPNFINRGGAWKPGDKLSVDLEALVKIAKLDLQKRYDKVWSLKHVSFDGYGEKNNKWVISFIFHSPDNDYVVIICNLKGEVWPLGKRYDEFDPASQ